MCINVVMRPAPATIAVEKVDQCVAAIVKSLYWTGKDIYLVRLSRLKWCESSITLLFASSSPQVLP